MINQTHTPATPTRRTVLRTAAVGAAWTTPAILGVSAAPAIAASTIDEAPDGGLGARPPAPPVDPIPAAPAHIHIGQLQFGTWQQHGHTVGGNFGVQITGPGLLALVSVVVTLSHPDWKQSQSLSFAGTIGESLRFNETFQFTEALTPGETYAAGIMFSGTLNTWIDYTTNTRHEGSWELQTQTLPAQQVTINAW